MTNDFIFDLDGTLTLARQHIDPQFKDFLHEFTDKHSCHICSGSDYDKIQEQLGKDLTNKFDTIFACSGNHHVSNGITVYKTQWQLNPEQEWFLIQQLDQIPYPFKRGKHLEKRVGSANLSIPGRNANLEDRDTFVQWNKRHQAREKLADHFNELYPQVEAVLGGETGIDIFQKGKSKKQILDEFDDTSLIYFFGDKICPGGNDYDIGVAIDELPHGKSFNVENWQQTFEILKTQF